MIMYSCITDAEESSGKIKKTKKKNSSDSDKETMRELITMVRDGSSY